MTSSTTSPPTATVERKQPVLLDRIAFRTSRLLDFCSRKELVAQTGHQVDDWPLVALKELVDNALDACEDARVAPKINILVDATGIKITDNGPGIPEATLTGMLDFSVRISNREAYVAPDRGRQGNALKTIVAMPFVLDGTLGRVDVEAHGIKHAINLTVDRIRQAPVIHVEKTTCKVKTGTAIRLHWPESASSILERAKARFLQIAQDYSFLNPHLHLSFDWHGQRGGAKPSDTSWRKWKPSDPTSPHWYRPEDLERLIAANVAHAQDAGVPARPVREFVAEFRGLSGTAKQRQVLDATGCARTSLGDLVIGGAIDKTLTVNLLDAMKGRSKPVKPASLGIIGEAHLRGRFETTGCAMESFDYRKVCGETDGLPWVVEVAFAAFNEAMENQHTSRERRLVTGVNWSPGIINPFRELGAVGKSLDSLLAEQRAGADEPVLMALHIACPRVEYMDRGKSSIVIGRADNSASPNGDDADDDFLQVDAGGDA